MTPDIRYPIGKFQPPAATLTSDERSGMIAAIAKAPSVLRTAVTGLTEKQLDTSYRPGGWTLRQVVHHLADSHLNAYTRFKLGLTEDRPTIRPYDEAKWAELDDARNAPIGISLELLEALHLRWVAMLESIDPSQFEGIIVHPDSGEMTLDRLLALYTWHGRHHTAHITALRAQMKWD
ncbi:MAG TPA: putative metal-dependent hydrolase [Thermoanaerobaculia bacterium]|nr:putative metal-dependent hydrolase [Thermoanaerobaculia bacterium]